MNARRGLAVGLLLAAITFISFARVFDNGFVDFDDADYVTQNPHVRAGITVAGVRWALVSRDAANWHPLTWLSHMADVELYGLEAGGHHGTSLLLHIANTILLFWVLARMTLAPWRSAAVAALFAVHPLHAESVAWVAERKDVLSTLFFMLTILAYVRYVERRGGGRYLLVLLLFALGLLAKPMLVTLPFVLLLLDYWPLRRFGLGVDGDGRTMAGPGGTSLLGLVREKAPFFVLTLASSVVTYWAQQGSGAVESWEEIPLEFRFSNALIAYLAYLGKMLWPRHLACLYPHPAFLVGGGLNLWKAGGAGLMLTVATLVALGQWRRRPYIPVGWLWYLGTLVPVIGIVQVGQQSMADRYTYVPLVGLFILVVWSIGDLAPGWTRHREVIIGALAAAAVSLCMIRTHAQVATWRDSDALFEHALQVTTDNYLAQNNVGVHLATRGKLDEAIPHLTEALRINPRYAKAHNNLGNALASQGRLDQAIAHHGEAVRLQPEQAEAHNNLGNALAMDGRLDEAIASFNRALRIRPTYAKAHHNLALVLARQGRIEEALDHFAGILREQTDYPYAYVYADRGIILAREGRTGEALADYRQALRLNPDWPEMLQRLAWALATSRTPSNRDPVEAMRLAVRAAELTESPRPEVLDVLAAAYAAAGRFAEARQNAERAVALALASGNGRLAQGIEGRLALYAAGQPYVAPQPSPRMGAR